MTVAELIAALEGTDPDTRVTLYPPPERPSDAAWAIKVTGVDAGPHWAYVLIEDLA